MTVHRDGTYGRPSSTGTPEAVAAEPDALVTAGAAGGSVPPPVPRPAPGGRGESAGRIVAPPRERDALRTEHTGTPPRSRLGPARPLWKG